MDTDDGHTTHALPGRHSRTTLLVPAVLLLIGLVLTAVATVVTARNTHGDRDRAFAAPAQEARRTLERRVGSYAEALYGLRGLFVTSQPVSRSSFHDYLSSADVAGRYPGVRSLSFVRLVPRSNSERFVRAVRGDVTLDGSGYPEFRIHPETTATDLFVVDYVEPLEGNEAAFGFDLGSETLRRSTVEEARDTGDLIATAPLRLVQEPNRQSGFLLMLAVYDTGSVPATAPARRRHFVGVVDAAFLVDDMLAGLQTARPAAIIAEIHDVGPTAAATDAPFSADNALIRAAGGVSALDPGSIPTPSRVLDLNVGNRRWRILATAGPGFGHNSGQLVAWIVGAGGSILSLLVAALVLSFARSRGRAFDLASAMTRDLRGRERELEAANHQLEATTGAMRDFVAVASHELRTPIATLVGYSNMLLRDAGTISDAQRKEFLEVIRRQAGRLAGLVNDLLVVSRIEAGVLETKPERVELAGAIAQVLEDLPDGAAGVVRTDSPACAVVVDPDHLHRVLVNYLANALRYGEPPIEVRTVVNGQWVEVRVCDVGQGVPEGFEARLFDRFARPARPQRSDGTGLGLWIVKGLAEANGGEVWHEPNTPQGACFGVRLPSADQAVE